LSAAAETCFCSVVTGYFVRDELESLTSTVSTEPKSDLLAHRDCSCWTPPISPVGGQKYIVAIVETGCMSSEGRRPDFRKVQVTGGNSFVVSLPKTWVTDVGLRAKDPVAVIVQPDSSLLIVPRRDIRAASKSEATLEAAQGLDKDFLLRHFISYYLAGYDTIRITLGRADSSLRGFIREGIRRKLVGVEIIEESSGGILTQCLSGFVDLPLKKALERMSIIAGGMLVDSVAVLQGGDKELAAEVIERDDEVDRFYHFLLRQLNIAVRDRSVIQEIGLSSTRDCLGYRLAVKSVERVADHAAGIAAQAENLQVLSEGSAKKVNEMTMLSKKVFDSSVAALIRLDGKMAEEAIARTKEVVQLEEKIGGEVLAPKMSSAQVASTKLMLESIRRVAEYGSDISEIAIDLTVAEPQSV
jgi:phosphate uptake regulator